MERVSVFVNSFLVQYLDRKSLSAVYVQVIISSYDAACVFPRKVGRYFLPKTANVIPHDPALCKMGEGRRGRQRESVFKSSFLIF